MHNIGAATFTQSRKRHSLRKRVYRYRYLYVMILPAIILMVIFHYVPMYGVQIAFRKYRAVDGIWGSTWVGLSNFKRMFGEGTFIQVFRNTMIISALKMCVSFPFGIIFALMLNEIRNMKTKRVIQTISYLPHFISWVVLAGVVKAVFSLSGPVNSINEMLGLEKVMYLSKSSAFRPILVLTDIWKNMGWNSVIFLAAISGVPKDLYEAGEMDGASRLQKIWYITFPSILPVVSIMFLMRVGRVMNAGFDQVFNLYSPLVYDVADILDTYVYRVGLIDMNFSYSTAIGLFKNIIGVVLMLTVNAVTKKAGEGGSI